MSIQLQSSDLSINTLQLTDCSWDLTLPPDNTENALVYGGVVTWLQDYDFHVSGAGYYINGVFYEAPAVDITLAPADPLLDRIDVFYADINGTIGVLQGTPSETASQPGLDLGTQIGLGVVLVQAATTEPVGAMEECAYIDNAEWSAFASDASINVASINTPCSGTSVIEGTTVTNGDYFKLVRGTTTNLLPDFTVLHFLIRSKGAWGSKQLNIQWFVGGVAVGVAIALKHNTFDFASNNVVDCQLVSINISDFNVPLSQQVDELRFTMSGGGDIGFFIDDICIQNNGSVVFPTDNDIHNQYFGPQTPGDYWIYGNALVEGWFTSPQRVAGVLQTGSEKFGWGSSTVGTTATAIGYLAQANGQEGATAVGNQSVANVGVAIGFGSLSTRGVAVGGASSASGGTAVGWGSLVTALSATALGGNASSSGIGGIAIGYYAREAGNYGGIAIGTSSYVPNYGSAAIGVYATTTANNQFIIGGHETNSDTGFNSLYFGSGVTSPFSADRFWSITGAEGTDIAGNKWTFAGARGTGAALSGTFEWQTSDVTVSGSTLQSLSTKMGLNSNAKGLYLTNVRFEMDRGADVVSANDLVLGRDGNGFLVSGSTQVNAILNTDWQAGSVIYLLFSGSPTLKHNTAGGAGTLRLQLAGSVDFTAAPGDLIALWNSGSYWHEIGRKVAASGGAGILSVDNALTLSTATNAQWGGTLLHDTTVDGVNTYGTLFDNQVFFQVNADADINLLSDGGANYSQIQLDNTANFATRIETVSPNMFSQIVHNDGTSTLVIDSNKSISIASDIRTVMDGRFEEDKGANVASANSMTLGLDGNLFLISGNVQINAITTANWQAGSTIKLEFLGTPTIKHNTAGGGGTAPIYLSGAVDYVAAVDDVLTLVYDGTNWHETARKSTAVGGTGILSADSGLRLSTATNVQLGGPLFSSAPLLQDTYVATNNWSIAFTHNGSLTGTVSSGIFAGENTVITGDSSAAVGGRNSVINANGAVSVGTDGNIHTLAHYAFLANDANEIWGESGSAFGFGNDVWGYAGFAIGSDNDINGTANQYTSSFVGGTTSSVAGNRAFAFGQSVSSTGTNVYTFGSSVSNTTAQSFGVGFSTSGTISPDFIVTEDKIRINSARFEEYKGVDVVSANDLTLGTDGNLFIVTGATQINAITTANWQAGSTIKLEFASTPTIKHNTAGGGGTAPILLSGAIDYVAAANDVLTLVYDGTSWHETARKSTAVGSTGIVSADNGLSLSSATNVQLGGPIGDPSELLNDRYIDATASYRLFVTGSIVGSSNYILNVTNSSTFGGAIVGSSTDAGNGVKGISVGGYGVLGSSTNGPGGSFTSSTVSGVEGISTTGVGGYFQVQPSSTNTTIDVVKLVRLTTGTAANGFGGTLNYTLQASDGTSQTANEIISKWTNATVGTRISQLDITGIYNAGANTIMSAYGSGVVGIGISSTPYGATRLSIVDNTVTTQNIVNVTSTSLSSGAAINVAVNSTAATGDLHSGIVATMTGANANAGEITTGVSGVSRHSGTSSTNFGVYGYADGGTVNVGVIGSIAGTGTSAAVYGTNSQAGYVGWFQASTTGIAVFADAANGTALQATSTGGMAVYALSSTGTVALKVEAGTGLGQSTQIAPVSNNTVESVAKFMRITTGAGGLGVNGIGGSFDLQASYSGGIANTNQIIWKWTEVTAGTRTSQLDITGVSNAVAGTIMSAYGTGVVGIGIATGYTASRLEVVDNSLSATSAMVKLTSTSTASSSTGHKLLELALSGANANSGQTTYGQFITNSHTGTGSLNYCLYASASGGDSNIAIRATAETYAIFGESNGGVGIRGVTQTGTAGTFVSNGAGAGVTISTQSGLGLLVDQTASAGTNDVTDLLEVRRQTSGTAAAGFGANIGYWLETDNGSLTTAAGISATWKVAANATKTSNVNVTAINAANGVTSLIIGGEGFIKFRPITATAASAITAEEGMVVMVSDTNGTFTSVGFWGYSGGAWAKF